MPEHWRGALCRLIKEVDCDMLCSFANFKSGDLWLALITFLYVSPFFLSVLDLLIIMTRMAVCQGDSVADEATNAFSWRTSGAASRRQLLTASRLWVQFVESVPKRSPRGKPPADLLCGCRWTSLMHRGRCFRWPISSTTSSLV